MSSEKDNSLPIRCLGEVVLRPKDGPVVHRDGTKFWYEGGVLHRLDGPAYIRPDGHKEWRKNGRKHRVGGPAVIYADGREEFWKDGVRIELSDLELLKQEVKELKDIVSRLLTEIRGNTVY